MAKNGGNSVLPDWIPTSEPSWWSTVVEFGTNPYAFIVEIVALWLVNGVIDVGKIVIEAVQWAFEPLLNFWDIAANAIEGAFGPIGSLLLSLPTMVRELLLSLVESLGPWAPFVVVPVAVLLAWLLVKATVALAETGIGTISPRIAELLGLN